MQYLDIITSGERANTLSFITKLRKSGNVNVCVLGYVFVSLGAFNQQA